MSSRYDKGLWERRRRSPGTTVEIDDQVVLDAPLEPVWERLCDFEAVAGCIPGLVPGSLVDEGGGRFGSTVRQTALGVTASWALHAVMRVREDDRVLDVDLEGEERRLGMRLEGSASVAVRPCDGGTSALDYRGRVEVTGRLAAAGAPIIRDMVEAILRRFVATIGGGPAPEERPSLLRRALERLRRLLP